MSYLFNKSYLAENSVNVLPNYFTIVLYEPHETLASMYKMHLEASEFRVSLCSELAGLLGHIRKLRPHLLIASIEGTFGGLSTGELGEITEQFPYLHVITVSDNLNDTDIGSLMSLGVNSHINRKFSRPRDIALVARNVTGYFQN